MTQDNREGLDGPNTVTTTRNLRMTWRHLWSRHTARTWVFACSWTAHEFGEWTGTIGFGKWSLHVYRRMALEGA